MVFLFTDSIRTAAESLKYVLLVVSLLAHYVNEDVSGPGASDFESVTSHDGYYVKMAVAWAVSSLLYPVSGSDESVSFEERTG